MYEGIDEFDELDEVEPQDSPTSDSGVMNEEEHIDETIQENNSITEPLDSASNEDTFVSELLKSRGIENPAKIKFENDAGLIEEVDWNSLDVKDKINILNSSTEKDEEDLDDSEIELINAIRESQLTPAEYLLYLQKTSVETYLLNMQSQGHMYSVDQYSDEELYVMDLISRSEEITEEEALEALERAKANETLFKKLMGAIRNEYKKAEDESLLYAKLKLEQEAQDKFYLFAEKIEDSIINFKEFSGCELNMSNDDMQDLYNFITGYDSAGNNWFSKALNDPETVVQMAWFVLNGEKMILDINDYYQKEITNVRKESYDKGLKDGAKKDKPTVAYKPKDKNTNVTQTYDDLDDF